MTLPTTTNQSPYKTHSMKQEFLRMNTHPITGFPLMDRVITKRERESKREYNRKIMQKIAQKKEGKNETV